MRAKHVRVRVAPGFTLVELLVVVAIVAVLIAILLPSLGRARDGARVVECLGQLRTLGQFAAMHADEHDGLMPRSQHSAFPNKVAPWGYAFFESISGQPYEQQQEGAWEAVFNGPYRCPLDDREDRWSYGYNVYFELTKYETGGPTWRRISHTPRPHATVVFGELNDLTTADHAMAHFWVQFDAPPEIDATRHHDSTGGAFLDGHAESVRFLTLFDLSKDTDGFNPATAK